MPERQEIEIKFVVSNVATLRSALEHAGAISQGLQEEQNIRLDDAEHSLSARGIVLRLRHTRSAQGEAHTLTVKMPQAGTDAAFSVRREAEVAINDAEAMLAALAMLGYTPYWRYEKRREIFHWGEVEVALDEMPFGWFLELEGPPQAIRNLAAQLSLRLEDGLTLSYAAIFENVRRALGLDIPDLTFEAFAGVEVPDYAYRDREDKASLSSGQR